MWFKSTAVLVVATLLGGLIGWSFSARNSPAPPPIPRPAPVQPTPRPTWTTGDFLASARKQSLQAKQPGFNPLAEKLADWTDEEIIAALNASLHDPDFALPSGAASGLDGLLLGEWMQRDLDAAIAWFDRLESVSTKSRLASALSYRWPADKSEQGLAFVLANRVLFPETTAWSILTKVLEGRAKQGPAAVENFLRTLREEKIEFSSEAPGHFPDHFDFATLANGDEFQQLWESGDAKPLILAWHSQNRDQAFDWLVENHGVKSLAAIASLADGDVLGNAKWLGGKVEALDAKQRGEFLEEMRETWTVHPTNLVAFAEGIADPGVLAEARLLGVQSVFAGQTHQMMPLLESIEDPAERIAILENARPSALFSRYPDYRRFDVSNESFLRRKLAEWHASDARIESIISRFKP